mgnify:CR=1 FL=1
MPPLAFHRVTNCGWNSNKKNCEILDFLIWDLALFAIPSLLSPRYSTPSPRCCDEIGKQELYSSPTKHGPCWRYCPSLSTDLYHQDAMTEPSSVENEDPHHHSISIKFTIHICCYYNLSSHLSSTENFSCTLLALLDNHSICWIFFDPRCFIC